MQNEITDKMVEAAAVYLCRKSCQYDPYGPVSPFDKGPRWKRFIPRAREFLSESDLQPILSAALAAAEAQPVASTADVIVLRADRENLHGRVRELRATITTLMAKLADLLDEDKFHDCEDIVRNAGIEPPANIADQVEGVARTIWLYFRGQDVTPVEAGAWFDNHKHLGGPAHIIGLIRSAMLAARPTPSVDTEARTPLPPAVTESELVEALRNAKGFLDTPISRRRNMGDSFYAATVESINAALANIGKD